MRESDKWPGSILDGVMLETEIGRFLRTHRNGWHRLMEWLRAVPPDRTEAEYEEDRARAVAEHEAANKAALDAYNQRRTAEGLAPINAKGELLES